MGSADMGPTVTHLTSATAAAASSARSQHSHSCDRLCATPAAAHALPGEGTSQARARGRRGAWAGPLFRLGKVLKQSPATRYPETNYFTSLFLIGQRPQPTRPRCSAGQSSCGLLGKVEGGDVSATAVCVRGGGGARAPWPRASEPRRAEVLDPGERERVKAG